MHNLNEKEIEQVSGAGFLDDAWDGLKSAGNAVIDAGTYIAEGAWDGVKKVAGAFDDFSKDLADSFMKKR